MQVIWNWVCLAKVCTTRHGNLYRDLKLRFGRATAPMIIYKHLQAIVKNVNPVIRHSPEKVATTNFLWIKDRVGLGINWCNIHISFNNFSNWQTTRFYKNNWGVFSTYLNMDQHPQIVRSWIYDSSWNCSKYRTTMLKSQHIPKGKHPQNNRKYIHNIPELTYNCLWTPCSYTLQWCNLFLIIIQQLF